MHLKLLTLPALLLSLVSSQVFSEDLMDIYKEAFIKDPLVLESKAQRDTAFEKINEATAALLPQINVLGSYGKTFTEENTLTGLRQDNVASSAQVNLSQSLWRHASWKQKTIAEKNAAAQDLIYNDALQQLILRVSTAYFNVLNSKDTLLYAKANQEALGRQLTEAKRRFQVGLIAETDMLEAQAAYDLATTSVITAENQLLNSYSEIRRIIGRDVRTYARLNDKKFSPLRVTKSINEILQSAKENNLSLQSAIILREIAKEQIILAKTGHEPTLDLTGSASTTYIDFDAEGANQRSGNTHESQVGIVLNIPIFSGGATSSQVQQAEHQYVAASERLEYTHRTVSANVSNGYNDVNAAISSIIAYEQSAKSAESALLATQSGYDVGTRTITDVLNATQLLYNAKSNLANARYKYILSRLQLLYDQGLLTVDDIEKVNSGLIK